MALRAAVKALAAHLGTIDYAFIGSVNLYLQGLDMQPRDIDILTTPEGIREIDGILARYRTKEIYFDPSEKRNSYRSFYDYQGKEVEVLGNVNNAHRDKNALARKTFVEIDGMQVPCLSLTEELAAYRKMGREDKAALIEKHIAARNRV